MSVFTNYESRLIARERRNMVQNIARRRHHRVARMHRHASAPVAHPTAAQVV